MIVMASTLEDALHRLHSSLDVLEAAVQRRQANDEVVAQLEDDVHLLAVDRAKLAEECDGLKAQTAALAHANGEVSKRLDQAVVTLREVLQSEDA